MTATTTMTQSELYRSRIARYCQRHPAHTKAVLGRVRDVMLSSIRSIAGAAWVILEDDTAAEALETACIYMEESLRLMWEPIPEGSDVDATAWWGADLAAICSLTTETPYAKTAKFVVALARALGYEDCGEVDEPEDCDWERLMERYAR